MSGSCIGCGASFGIFKKEIGCKNCGLVYCKDCLSKKASIPKQKNEVHKVCNKCYKILTGKNTSINASDYSPPEIHKKKMAALSVHNQLNNASISKDKNKKDNSKDEVIRMRLENLKKRNDLDVSKNVASVNDIQERLENLRDRENIPSEDEIRSRLSKLKGDISPENEVLNHAFSHKASNITVQTTLNSSECDTADKLIEAAMHEVQLEKEIEGEKGNKNFYLNNDKDYSKKFLPPTEDFCYVSNERLSFTELQIIVSKVANECNLDAKKALDDIQKDNEVMEHISKLWQKKKDNNIRRSHDQLNRNSSITDSESSSDEEEEEIRKIILDALEDSGAELNIHSSCMGSISPKSKPKTVNEDKKCNIEMNIPAAPSSSEFEEELPWCVLCNDDAILRCIGCEGDLYCRRCFKQFHRDEGERHYTTSYNNSAKNHR